MLYFTIICLHSDTVTFQGKSDLYGTNIFVKLSGVYSFEGVFVHVCNKY